MILLTNPSLLRTGQKISRYPNHSILRRFSLQKLYNSSVSSASLKVSLLMNFKVTFQTSTTLPFHTHQNRSSTNVTFATKSLMTPFTLKTIWWASRTKINLRVSTVPRVKQSLHKIYLYNLNS